MKLEALQNTPITRRRFLQLSILGAAGLLVGSPALFNAKKPSIPEELKQSLSQLQVSKVIVLSQDEYDNINHDPTTLYVVA